MFIKFSDKTKKIMVKKGLKDNDVDGYVDSDCIYLGEKDQDDRRADILREQLDGDPGSDK